MYNGLYRRVSGRSSKLQESLGLSDNACSSVEWAATKTY